jgi:hypothetical protein
VGFISITHNSIEKSLNTLFGSKEQKTGSPKKEDHFEQNHKNIQINKNGFNSSVSIET